VTETATYGKTLYTSEGAEEIALLREREMKFERVIVDLDDIDTDASTRNQARLLPVHQETVEIYRSAMEAGDKFPPIVLNGTKTPYVVLDGNHRLFAAKIAGYTTTEALVVRNATKQQMELYTYEANARHGLPTTVAERVKQGIYLVNLGNEAVTVARALAIPERRLWEALQAARTDRRLSKLGVDPGPITQNMRRRLSSIRSDVVLAPFTEILVKSEMGAEEASTEITKINGLASEAEQLAYVEQLREKYRAIMESTAGGALDLPRDVVRLRMAARLLRNIDEAHLAESLDRVAPEFREVIGREVVESVSALLAASALLAHDKG
jgi:hypothetical protein